MVASSESGIDFDVWDFAPSSFHLVVVLIVVDWDTVVDKVSNGIHLFFEKLVEFLLFLLKKVSIFFGFLAFCYFLLLRVFEKKNRGFRGKFNRITVHGSAPLESFFFWPMTA